MVEEITLETTQGHNHHPPPRRDVFCEASESRRFDTSEMRCCCRSLWVLKRPTWMSQEVSKWLYTYILLYIYIFFFTYTYIHLQYIPFISW